MRYIVVSLALALIIFWVVRAARGRGPDQQLPKDKAGEGRPSIARVEDMVSCAHCGLHLPKAEAVRGKNHGETSGKGAMYCSADHQRQAES
jgi:uncharacterized protein